MGCFFLILYHIASEHKRNTLEHSLEIGTPFCRGGGEKKPKNRVAQIALQDARCLSIEDGKETKGQIRAENAPHGH